MKKDKRPPGGWALKFHPFYTAATCSAVEVNFCIKRTSARTPVVRQRKVLTGSYVYMMQTDTHVGQNLFEHPFCLWSSPMTLQWEINEGHVDLR